MQMRIDDPADICGRVTELAQSVLEFGSAALPRIVDAVNVDELAVLLVADAGVDEDQAVVVLIEQATQRERDAMAVVERRAAGPERLVDEAPHGAGKYALAPSVE